MRTSLPSLAACALAVSTLGFAPAPESKGKVFLVTFTKAAKDATTGYGRFAYETTTPGWKAEVSGGRLRLLGDHDEGDQRLFVTAQKAIGKPKWPDSFEVTAKLGGSDKENVAWHVGVSIGSVKVLFHPNFPGGAFRAERVDTHDEFFANEDMGFTPAAGVMHQLTIKVRRTERHCRFEVELVSPDGSGTYRKTFEVSNKQVGRFDRIGLERSGRRGGDALFESVSIKLGK
jgi:hypothetical protein